MTATNIDLRDAIKRREFRSDLFFRLHVVPIIIPPLRERREDIPVLMAHLLALYSQRHGHKLPGFSEEAISAMLSYGWPGNVGELENVIERDVNFAQPGEPLAIHNLFTSGEKLSDTRYELTSAGTSHHQRRAEPRAAAI